MNNDGYGHVINAGGPPPRCGGPTKCPECARQLSYQWEHGKTDALKRSIPGEFALIWQAISNMIDFAQETQRDLHPMQMATPVLTPTPEAKLESQSVAKGKLLISDLMARGNVVSEEWATLLALCVGLKNDVLIDAAIVCLKRFDDRGRWLMEFQVKHEPEV